MDDDCDIFLDAGTHETEMQLASGIGASSHTFLRRGKLTDGRGNQH